VLLNMTMVSLQTLYSSYTDIQLYRYGTSSGMSQQRPQRAIPRNKQRQYKRKHASKIL